MSEKDEDAGTSIEQLTELINATYKAVDASVVGKIVISVNPEGVKIVDQLAVQTFLTMITQICPKGLMTSETMLIEPKEDWEK